MFERRAFGILQLTSLSFDLEYFDESLDVKHKNPELFSHHSKDKEILRNVEDLFTRMRGDEFTAPAYDDLCVLFDV